MLSRNESTAICFRLYAMIQTCTYLYSSMYFPRWVCCNLSSGVALIVWFTTNGMCVKNNTIICVARASNSKRDCDVVALLILTCERLNVTTSVRKERLRAWSLLLLAATVRSFARMPLGISDHNRCKQGIDQRIFNRKSISRRIMHPQSWKLQAKLTGEKLKGWSNIRQKTNSRLQSKFRNTSS